MTLLSSPASAIGLATYAGDTLLEAWYPSPALSSTPVAVDGLGEVDRSDDLRGVRTVAITTTIADLSVAPADAALQSCRDGLVLSWKRGGAPR